MATPNNLRVPDDLLAQLQAEAAAEGKTVDALAEDALRRHLARERLERLARLNEQRASDLGIKESDVPRVVKEFRREQRGR
jgi:hypothetical protein